MLLPRAIVSTCAISPTISKGVGRHYGPTTIRTPGARDPELMATLGLGAWMCPITPA
jgi:hypothetical protein